MTIILWLWSRQTELSNQATEKISPVCFCSPSMTLFPNQWLKLKKPKQSNSAIQYAPVCLVWMVCVSVSRPPDWTRSDSDKIKIPYPPAYLTWVRCAINPNPSGIISRMLGSASRGNPRVPSPLVAHNFLAGTFREIGVGCSEGLFRKKVTVQRVWIANRAVPAIILGSRFGEQSHSLMWA